MALSISALMMLMYFQNRRKCQMIAHCEDDEDCDDDNPDVAHMNRSPYVKSRLKMKNLLDQYNVDT